MLKTKWYWNINEGGRYFTTAGAKNVDGSYVFRVYLFGKVFGIELKKRK